MIEKAQKRSTDLGVLRTSIEEGQANLQGMLGEAIVSQYFNVGYDQNTFDYDFIIKGLRIDVKTKQTKGGISANFETSIYNTQQNCDGYIFCRIEKDHSYGYIVGFITKKEYFEKASFIGAGTVDGSNGFTHKRNCYNLPITQLHNISEIKK